MSDCCCNQSKNNEDFVIYGTQFTSPSEYCNAFLRDRFRIYLRGLGFLTKGVEWDYHIDGGFKILMAGYAVTPDTIINGQFY